MVNKKLSREVVGILSHETWYIINPVEECSLKLYGTLSTKTLLHGWNPKTLERSHAGKNVPSYSCWGGLCSIMASAIEKWSTGRTCWQIFSLPVGLIFLLFSFESRVNLMLTHPVRPEHKLGFVPLRATKCFCMFQVKKIKEVKMVKMQIYRSQTLKS